jgi:DNA-binding response OmpR family regulator
MLIVSLAFLEPLMKSFYLENEEMLQKTMSKVFERSEHEIYTKYAFEEWFYLLSDLKPDLLIVDHDSLERTFLEKWPEILSTQIPVIITRTEHSDIAPEVLQHKNVKHILSKPFSPFEFLELVEKILVLN